MPKPHVKAKPVKPRPDYPLTAHASGKWCKKIRGRIVYFGRWEDPDGAEREYDRVKHDLRAGREPVATIDPATLTVKELFNAFLIRQHDRMDNDKIEDRSYLDQLGWLKRFVAHVGGGRLVTDLHPGDFADYRPKLDGKAPSTINRAITLIKSPFLFALRNGLIPKPIVFGEAFDKESVSAKRKAAKGKRRHFEPKEIRAILKAAKGPLKAMILLGINCGFGATDCADLDRWSIDLDDGWLEFDRDKTGNLRAAPLWPETVNALRESIAARPKSRHEVDDAMVFLTKYGNRWVHTKRRRDEGGVVVAASRIDPIGHDFIDLLKSIKLHVGGRGFSALRKTFRTTADAANDRNATLLIMGHAFTGMDEWYVKAVVRTRLLKVTNHVRKVLLNAK